MAWVVDAVGRRANSQSFPPRSGFVQGWNPKSAMPAASTAKPIGYRLFLFNTWNHDFGRTKLMAVAIKRAKGATQVLAPGKRGWPLSTPWLSLF